LNAPKIKHGDIENSSTESEKPTLKEWRNEKIWKLRSRGYSYREILEELKTSPDIKVSMGTIANAIKEKEEEIDEAYRNYVDKTLPYQHNLALTNLQSINKQAWAIFESSKDEKIKLQALHTTKEAQAAINDLMTAPESIQKAIKVVGKLKGHLHKGDSQ
jgi:transcriptional regulator